MAHIADRQVKRGDVGASVRAALLVGAVGALGACATSTGALPPDFSPAQGLVAARMADLGEVEGAVRREAERFDAMHARFREDASALARPGFPMDRHKFVLMSCLNQVWTMRVGPAVASANLSFEGPERCREPFLEDWQRDLGPLSTGEREAAMEQLAQVEGMRQVRAQLLARIGSAGDLVAQSREVLAEQRAELRKARAEMARRQASYRPENWELGQARLDSLQTMLDTLETGIEALETSRQQWPGWVRARLDVLYREIGALATTDG